VIAGGAWYAVCVRRVKDTTAPRGIGVVGVARVLS